MSDVRSGGECECDECEANRCAKAAGAAEERARVVAWLRGPHACSGLVAWHESMPPIYDDIAHDIERGAHLEKT